MLEKKNPKHGRESEWLESALRIAHSLTFGSFGDAINSNNITGTTVEELMDKRAIFELQTLNSSEKKFFCEFILSYVFFTKKANESKKSEFKGLILVDEAHNIFLKDKPLFVNESVTDTVYREMREYGFSLVCVDQHISKLSETVAGNSATNIAFQQMLPRDVETVSNLMQMYHERKFFTMLPVGQAIVKLAERHYHPFLIKAPFIKAKEENIDDKFIKERMSKLVKTTKRIKAFKEGVKEENLVNQIKKKYKVDSIKKGSNTLNHLQLFLVGEIKQFLKSGFEPAKIQDYLVKQGHKNEDIKRALKNVSMDPKIVEETKNFINANETAKLLLRVVKNKSFPTTKIYKKLGISARKGNELKKQLLYLGLIEELEQRNEKGWKKLVQITDKGLLSI
jgi:predicted transcriptional regulator